MRVSDPLTNRIFLHQSRPRIFSFFSFLAPCSRVARWGPRGYLALVFKGRGVIDALPFDEEKEQRRMHAGYAMRYLSLGRLDVVLVSAGSRSLLSAPFCPMKVGGGKLPRQSARAGAEIIRLMVPSRASWVDSSGPLWLC